MALFDTCIQKCVELQGVTNIPHTPFSLDESYSFCNYALKNRFCSVCPYVQKDEMHTHLYGLNEAFRWGGSFVYYCPMALVFVATALHDEGGALACGIISGPIVMGDVQDSTCYMLHEDMHDQLESVIKMSTLQVNQLAEVVKAVANSITESQAGRGFHYDQQQFLNTIYDVRAKYSEAEDHYAYILSAEDALSQLIANHDREGSQDLLNRLLGHIYFYHSGDVNDIKARALELIVVISRALISAGADVGQIFRFNADHVREIDRFSTIDELSQWLSQVVQQVISVSFDYTSIKHVNIVYKVMDYIRNNYRSKLTLDEIAGEVYLSKPYLSSVFRQETGLTIFAFINKTRVEASKTLLRSTKKSLLEIAFECGFDGQSYFTRIFKQQVGMPPGKYRSAAKPIEKQA